MTKSEIPKEFAANIKSLELAVLASYTLAKGGMTHDAVLDLFIKELRAENKLDGKNIDYLKYQIETGFIMHMNYPDLTQEQVVDGAWDHFKLLFSLEETRA
jgi:hypothetical protein